MSRSSRNDKKDIVQKLRIPYNILLLKLSGKQGFTVDEAVQIHDLIQAKKSIEELFS